MANEPTHHVRHVDRFEADIYISPKTLEILNGSVHKARDTARKFVCSNFKKACDKKYGDNWRRHHLFVIWTQIDVKPLY